MRHIIGDGEGFGFKDQALIDYVELAIRTVLGAGAVPVKAIRGSEYDWYYQPQYGTTHQDIVKNVMTEWLANGGGEDSSPVWFARPGTSISTLHRGKASRHKRGRTLSFKQLR